MRHLGPEFLHDADLNAFHRFYIRVFGIPISGMRIRLRRILPEIRRLAESGRIPATGKIADLGCGRGIFSFEMGRILPRADVVGIDIDEKQVATNADIVRAIHTLNVRFLAADILKLKSEGEYDFILSVDNLEHIEDDRAALASLRRALRPGGAFLCHVPGRERTWFFFGRASNFDVPGHRRPGYGREEFEEKLRGVGFKIIWVKETYGYLETITNNISYKITGAEKRNVLLYALIFPILNLFAWLGRHQSPKGRGAGWLALAEREK